MLKEAAAVPRELFLGKLIPLGFEPRNIIVSLEHHLPGLPIYGLEVLGWLCKSYYRLTSHLFLSRILPSKCL
jgi:hypothetical protein